MIMVAHPLHMGFLKQSTFFKSGISLAVEWFGHTANPIY
jgi:hypothetical protein